MNINNDSKLLSIESRFALFIESTNRLRRRRTWRELCFPLSQVVRRKFERESNDERVNIDARTLISVEHNRVAVMSHTRLNTTSTVYKKRTSFRFHFYSTARDGWHEVVYFRLVSRFHFFKHCPTFIAGYERIMVVENLRRERSSLFIYRWL